jgi:hypothetical protein
MTGTPLKIWRICSRLLSPWRSFSTCASRSASAIECPDLTRLRVTSAEALRMALGSSVLQPKR